MALFPFGWYGVRGGKLLGGRRESDDIPILGVTHLDADGNSVESSAGIVGSASFTPAAAAYSAGDIQDVAKEISFVDRNGVAVPAGSLIRITTAITKISVAAVPSGMTSYNLQCYSVTPPSAQADNDAWTLASGDLDAYSGSINLGAPADLGNALYVKSQYTDFDIKLADGKTSIFAQLVTVGAFTATAIARQVLLRGFVW